MSESAWKSRGLWALIGLPVLSLGLTAVCVGMCAGVPCFSTGLRYGIWADECPAGDLRIGASVQASGLLRGADDGWVWVNPYARVLHGDGSGAWASEEPMYRGRSATIELVDGDGVVVPMSIVEQIDEGPGIGFRVKLPEFADGDYTLRAHVTSFEDIDVAVSLPFYAPAIAHLMTDRPLYKPGQDVLLRSVMFRRTDLVPLEGRPGKWHVTSPDGTEMLVEKDKAGSYGVADSSFPLDDRAQVGEWTAMWTSGTAQDVVKFDVRPFRLPRFSVEAKPNATWYTRGDKVIVEGTAKYSSGAPVKDAPVQVDVALASGRWPMPLAWEQPFVGTTDAYGKFSIPIGNVPADLIEKNTLSARVTVTEAAGETIVGGTSIVLSQYDLIAEAVTELGDGLVGGFNNRAYLRLSKPDGAPIADTDVKVTPWWDASAKPFTGRTDVDGVAALQLDPGDPVTVVIDAPPYRPRPLTPEQPYLSSATEAMDGRDLDLDERRTVDRLLADVGACGDYASGSGTVDIGVRVDAGGNVQKVMTEAGLLQRCVADVMQRAKFPSGDVRTYVLSWYVPDSLRPSLSGSADVAYGDGFDATDAFDEAALRARRCIPRGTGIDGSEVLRIHWSIDQGSKAITTAFAHTDGEENDDGQMITGGGLSPGVLQCVRGAFGGMSVPEVAEGDAMGTASYALSVPSQDDARPQATTTTGYQLRVEAIADKALVGMGPIILNPGAVPDLRIRASETLLHPGENVEFDLIRGPNFSATIPEKMWLYDGTVAIVEATVDPKARKVAFTIPTDKDGFLYTEFNGVRSVVWVEPKARLEVALSTDQATYRPGESAKLTITTTAGGSPTAAGVGLVGVDATLAQLAPLLGPQEYGRVTVRETADRPAFGAFDPRALVLGEVRGENAAKAAVMRITGLPMDAAGDDRLSGSEKTVDHDLETLTTSFYRALSQVTDDVHAWEAGAASGDVMTDEKMVDFWDNALATCRSNGKPAVDAFGRPLTLNLLPYDLLMQVDPRQVVSDATKLPEDITAWDRFVAEKVTQ